MMDSSYASSILRISLDESTERLEVVAFKYDFIIISFFVFDQSKLC